MSVHSSLRMKAGMSRSRNVFKRVERLEALEKSGKRQAKDSVYGLPKVRTRFKVKKVKAAGEAKAAAPAAAAAAAPAAGAKAAPGGKPAAAAPAKKEAAKK